MHRLMFVLLALFVLVGCGGPKASAELNGEWISSIGKMNIDFSSGKIDFEGDVTSIDILEDGSDFVKFRAEISDKVITLRRIDDDEADYTVEGQSTMRIRRLTAFEKINEGLK